MFVNWNTGNYCGFVIQKESVQYAMRTDSFLMTKPHCRFLCLYGAALHYLLFSGFVIL